MIGAPRKGCGQDGLARRANAAQPTLPIAFATMMLAAALVLNHGIARGEGRSDSASAQRPTRVACQLNTQRGSCLVTPTTNGGLRLQVKGGPPTLFVFTPAGPPTTLNRVMRDAKGQLWLMTGHRSFTLRQVGGRGDVIRVADR
ncbi:MAG: hypothetical protein VKI42_06485 [Synechococcaceae cyanobacterium]|nr:hypothetical protein [Synechococcaceae cyanobacterium]